MSLKTQVHRDLAKKVVESGKGLHHLEMRMANIHSHPDSRGSLIRDDPLKGFDIRLKMLPTTNNGRAREFIFNPFHLNCELTKPRVIEMFLEDIPYWVEKRGYEIYSSLMNNREGNPILMVYDKVVFNPGLMTDFASVREYCKEHSIDLQELH